MTLLDKLEALQASGSGPRPYDDPKTCTDTDPCSGYEAEIAYDAAVDKLASLAPHIPKLVAALVCVQHEWCGTCYSEFGDPPKVDPPSCLDEYKKDHRRTRMCNACSLTKELEEAISDQPIAIENEDGSIVYEGGA